MDRVSAVRLLSRGNLLLGRGPHVFAPLVPRPVPGMVDPTTGTPRQAPLARGAVGAGRRRRTPHPLLLCIRLAHVSGVALVPWAPARTSARGRAGDHHPARVTPLVPRIAGESGALADQRQLARRRSDLAPGPRPTLRPRLGPARRHEQPRRLAGRRPRYRSPVSATRDLARVAGVRPADVREPPPIALGLGRRRLLRPSRVRRPPPYDYRQRPPVRSRRAAGRSVAGRPRDEPAASEDPSRVSERDPARVAPRRLGKPLEQPPALGAVPAPGRGPGVLGAPWRSGPDSLAPVRGHRSGSLSETRHPACILGGPARHPQHAGRSRASAGRPPPSGAGQDPLSRRAGTGRTVAQDSCPAGGPRRLSLLQRRGPVFRAVGGRLLPGRAAADPERAPRQARQTVPLRPAAILSPCSSTWPK